MPHLASAKKALRKNAKRQIHNKSIKSAVKTRVKKLLNAIESGNADDMKRELALTTKKYYQAVTKKVIHKNYAARHISRLSRKVNAASSS